MGEMPYDVDKVIELGFILQVGRAGHNLTLAHGHAAAGDDRSQVIIRDGALPTSIAPVGRLLFQIQTGRATTVALGAVACQTPLIIEAPSSLGDRSRWRNRAATAAHRQE